MSFAATRPRLLFVRHAPVVASAAGRCYGVTDIAATVPLSVAAERVLAQLKARFDDRADAVWSSPLSRCADPAGAIARALTIPLAVDERLCELDHGDFEGRGFDEIHSALPEEFARWGSQWVTEGPPNGESAEALESRVRAWHGELDPGRVHMLFGHAGVFRALRVIRAGDSWVQAMSRTVEHLLLVEV